MAMIQKYDAETRQSSRLDASEYPTGIDASVDLNMDSKDTLGLEDLTVSQARKTSNKPSETRAGAAQSKAYPSRDIGKQARPYDAVPLYQVPGIPPLGRARIPQSSGPIATVISHDADHSPRRGTVLQSGAFNVIGAHSNPQSKKKHYDPRSREAGEICREKLKTQLPAHGIHRPLSLQKTEHAVEYKSDRKKPLPPPEPTAGYLSIAGMPTRLVSRPQHLLLVLDLNGTLIDRQKGSSKYTPRPSLQPFLRYCFANHSVLVWSSARPANVRALCSQIFTPQQRRQLLGEWGRDTLDLTNDEYNAKTQVYKRLNRIWNGVAVHNSHPSAANGGGWSQANTLLLDDSIVKAQAQPFNLVEIPEFIRQTRYGEQEKGLEVLKQVMTYLEVAKSYEDVSAFVRENRFAIRMGFQATCERSQKLEAVDTEDGGVRIF